MPTAIVEWDTDGETIEGLPTRVDVPDYLDEDEIADWLSDEYGWLVEGFYLESESFEAEIPQPPPIDKVLFTITGLLFVAGVASEIYKRRL